MKSSWSWLMIESGEHGCSRGRGFPTAEKTQLRQGESTAALPHPPTANSSMLGWLQLRVVKCNGNLRWCRGSIRTSPSLPHFQFPAGPWPTFWPPLLLLLLLPLSNNSVASSHHHRCLVPPLLLHRLWDAGSLPTGPCQLVLKHIRNKKSSVERVWRKSGKSVCKEIIWKNKHPYFWVGISFKITQIYVKD